MILGTALARRVQTLQLWRPGAGWVSVSAAARVRRYVLHSLVLGLTLGAATLAILAR